jgi:hypothetical protein
MRSAPSSGRSTVAPMVGEERSGTNEVTTDTGEYILRSYRHLRLAIVVLLVGLFAGVIWQWRSTGCIEGSISAYFYTPVHSLFIGALVATGAAMVALKGRTTVEDSFFNVAGLLAPVIALVPTTRQDTLCDSTSVPLDLDRDGLVPNSLLALLVAGAAILTVTATIAWRRQKLKKEALSIWYSMRTGVAPSVALAIAAVVTVVAFRQPWYTFLHFGSAGGMFVAMFLAIGSLLSERLHRVLHITLTWARPTDRYRKPRSPYYGRYRAVLYATVAFVVAAIVLGGRARLFWVEVVGVASFTAFWTVQTAELWDRLPEPAPEPGPTPKAAPAVPGGERSRQDPLGSDSGNVT